MKHWTLQKFSQPWPYIIVDNFFDSETLSYIESRLLRDKKEYLKQFKKHAHQQPGGYLFENLPDYRLRSYFDACVNESFLKTNFSFYRGFDKELYSELDIKVSYKPYAQRIHDETPSKVLSTVVYVAPAHNVGTVIFDENKNFHGVVTWRPNRALIFAPSTGLTWHSFGNWENDKRITIDYFLMRQQCDFDLPDKSSI